MAIDQCRQKHNLLGEKPFSKQVPLGEEIVARLLVMFVARLCHSPIIKPAPLVVNA